MLKQMSLLKQVTLVLASVTLLAAPAPAQVPDQVPIPAVTGTIGLDGTIDKFYGVSHRALVKTADGVRHVVHFTGRTSVHGTQHTLDDPFGGLEEGSMVAVHYVANGNTKEAIEVDRVGDGGLSVVDGTVMDVDRERKRLTIQIADEKRVTLRLTDRAANDVGKDVKAQARVIVYYADDGGDLVAHYFRKAK